MTESGKAWTMPVLRSSGGDQTDPAEICAEADAILALTLRHHGVDRLAAVNVKLRKYP